jgi:hypothetical protein
VRTRRERTRGAVAVTPHDERAPSGQGVGATARRWSGEPRAGRVVRNADAAVEARARRPRREGGGRGAAVTVGTRRGRIAGDRGRGPARRAHRAGRARS